MNKNLKIFLIIIASIFIAGGSLAYGAMTAPKPQQSQKPQPSPSPVLTKEQLKSRLLLEQPAITQVLLGKYPLIATAYTIDEGRLYDRGQWYGTTLTYKGSDKDNRDTLRVLMQKKNDMWVIRSTPPRMLLSAKDFLDVPVSILKSINQPVSLPGDNSPAV